jgi:hypothetical protein
MVGHAGIDATFHCFLFSEHTCDVLTTQSAPLHSTAAFARLLFSPLVAVGSRTVARIMTNVSNSLR